MEEVIIIQQDGKSITYKKESNDKEYYHSYYLKQYAKENNINITDSDSTGIIASDLTKTGLSILIIENRYLLVYLPEVLSKQQLKFYLDKKNVLRRFNIDYSYMEDGKIKYAEYDDEFNNSFRVRQFYNYIKKNIEEQKKGDIDEYMPNI